jgi:zinc transporter ZupT
MQVLSIVRTVVEWIVLISLIVSTFTTSWLVANRRSSRVEILLTGLRASVVLGVLAGCTAFILENWTPLLIFDVLFAIAQAMFFMVSASIFPKMGSESTSFGKESEP